MAITVQNAAKAIYTVHVQVGPRVAQNQSAISHHITVAEQEVNAAKKEIVAAKGAKK